MLRLPTNSNKHILVCHEDDIERYFDASTPEAFAKSCLAILTYRVRDYGYYEKWDIPEEPAGLLSPAQIEALPTEELRHQEASKRRAFRSRVTRYEEHNAQIDEALKVIEEQDTELIEVRRKFKPEVVLGYETRASRILSNRSDHEYEHVELERLEEG